jgi:hypothetical protein
MYTSGSCFRKSLIICWALTIAGCASVPKEVVELSYTVGHDLDAVHLSYRALIQTHFEGLRAQTITFLETRWVPAFLGDFIQNGGLIQSAQGADPTLVLEEVQDWTEVAVEAIEKKKRALLDPINADETALIKSVDEAFANLIRANATITAHLNSLRKVQEVQDEALKALKLKELRDKINGGLISASERAQKAIADLKKVEGGIEAAEKKKNLLREKLTGEQSNE